MESGRISDRPESRDVLLVEDEAAVRRAAFEFLSSIGYKVLGAADGLQALDVARSHSGPIHILVTDVVMPNMSGAQLAEQLLKERPGVKVLFVSGYAEKTVLQHGDIDLSARFLQKPFTLKALGQKIRTTLESQRDEACPSVTAEFPA